MDGRFRSRYFVADMAILAVVALLVVILGLASSGHGRGGPQATVTIDPGAAGRPVPPGFLGFSLEYPSVEAYAGTDPLNINPVFEQLMQNLTPGQAPVLRIGGDSADRTWWPVAGTPRPPGITFALSPRWLQVTRALTAALHARLILGLNFEAGSPALAAAEASALLAGVGHSSVRALELGNEPELYGSFAWYRTPDGRGVTGRPPGYDYTQFASDFTKLVGALPTVPLAGPAFGSFAWTNRLTEFLTAQPRVGLVTLHRYPLQRCFVGRGSPRYATINHLLSATATTGLADRFVPFTAIAHARGLPLRLDELNTVSCGAVPAVSQSFASALWALDALFEMVRVGVDGVNIHTFPGAGYELFTFSRTSAGWRASVSPEYYGLLMFATAAPSGARLLRISGAIRSQLKVWATLAPDRRIRVVLINRDVAHARIVVVRAPATGRAATGGGVTGGAATLERLQAPGPAATSGVTLAGQRLGSPTVTGLLQGPPRTISVTRAKDRYVVSLPAASAALLTLPPQ